MLLVVDVGNTHTVLGIFDQNHLIGRFRIQTNPRATGDEFAYLVSGLFSAGGIDLQRIERTVVSSVAPAMASLLETFCRRYLGKGPLWVDASALADVPIRCINPSEIGADRIVNTVAAYHKFSDSLIVIDFGTATTFDAVSKAGEFLGGAISPGLGIAADALYARAAKLPRVELLKPPAAVIGKDTITAIQSGILFGYAGMVDSMVQRMKSEMGATPPPRIIATGGLAPLMKDIAKTIEVIEPDLTLEGLRLIGHRMKDV